MGTAIKKHVGDFVAIVAVFALAVGIAAYILVNQDARPTFPLIEPQPKSILAEFSDAQAVVPGQGQSVRVAGVQVGKIGSVELVNGLAVVELQIEAEYEDMVRQDASALLRPRTGLKDMFVELDPGTEEAPVLEEGDRITVENTAPDIDPDEILAALDTDARAYLKLLVSGLGKGLDGRGEDLREVFKRFEPLHRDLARVQGAFADRREALSALIHNYGILTQELGRNDEDLQRLVTASNDVFEAFASENENISRAVALFPGALRTTENTLRKVDALGEVLGPTLDDLRPAMQALCGADTQPVSSTAASRCLDGANREVLPLVREATPIVRDEIRPFVRRAQPYVGNNLKPAARNLARNLPDLTTSFGELNRLFNMLAFNPAGHNQAGRTNPVTGNSGDTNRGGESVGSSERDEGYLFWLGWVVNNTVSLHSTSDPEGPIRRVGVTLNCDTITALILPAIAEGELLPVLPAPAAQTIAALAPTLAGCTGAVDAIPDLNLPPLPGGPGGVLPLSAEGERGAAQERGEETAPGEGEETLEGESEEATPGAEPGRQGTQGLGTDTESSGGAAPEETPLETGEDDGDGSG